MGEPTGRDLALAVFKEIQLEQISSAADLRRFAVALSQRGGFAAAVGALLVLHVTMYEETSSPS